MTSGRESLGSSAILRSLLDTIGETPMVELRHLCDESKGRLVCKLESMNPTGSKDDRVARQVLTDARDNGRLGRCQTVVAATDGVMGLSLAQACAVMRHPFIAVMSRGCAVSQIAALAALGCEVVLVDQHPDSPPGRLTAADRALCTEEVAKLVSITGAYDPDLLRNASAHRAHRTGTGDEIVRQAGGHFGAFVDFVATGALFSGCATAFHEFDPSIRCYAAEPIGAAALSGEAVVLDDHGIDGGGLGLAELPLLTRESLAGIVQVTRQEAYSGMVDLARKEGIFTGLSTGANLAAARKLLEGECFGETIVFVVHDNGARQISASVRALDLGARDAA